jgi:diguanylate cyclase (GGDEF)-like protein/PAS domain S-box-containing protein
MNKIDNSPPGRSGLLPPSVSFSKSLSLLVVGVGCLVLAGWALDIAVLKSIVPGLTRMVSNTALLFVLSGASLWLQIQRRSSRVALVCAIIVSLAGLFTLGEYLFNTDFGIDQLLFRDTSEGILYPGRMAPSTTVAFLMIGLALMVLDGQPGNPFKESPVIIVFVISALALIGYIYGVSSLYKIGAYTSMALPTALNFVLLSIAILFARPERGLVKTVLADTPGGNILRRFLPTAIVAPILLGWIRLWGQRAGLYDTPFGLALMVLSLITTLTTLIWFNAAQMTGLDAKRRRAEHASHEGEARYRRLFENMHETLVIQEVVTDDAGRAIDLRYLDVNPATERILGRPRSEIVGRTRSQLSGQPDPEGVELARSAASSGEPIHTVRLSPGFGGWFESVTYSLGAGIVATMAQDITERKLAEDRFRLAIESAPNAVIMVDQQGRIVLVNSQTEQYFGYARLELVAENIEKLVPARFRGNHADHRAGFFSQPRARPMGAGRDLYGLRKDGMEFPVEIGLAPIETQQGILVIATIVDITERKQAEGKILKLNAELEQKVAERTAELAAANAQLHQLSLFDELTGLYNRRGFLSRAAEYLHRARLAKHNLLIFYADLDGLKEINDNSSHTAGDNALVEAAAALQNTFRTSDIIARLGGDEFIVLAMKADEHDARTLLARLHEQLALKSLSMSVGQVAIDPQREESVDVIIDRADQAMYAEKHGRSNRRKA